MSTLKYVSGEPNLQTVTLTSDYTAADGHMHLTAGHGARLPSAGDFWIRTPATGDVLNIFKVTAVSGDDLTVTCVTGYGADANRAAGTVFSWSFTGEALDQFRSDLTQTGADASKVAEKAGNLYLPSDGIYIRRDSGAAFANWGPVFPCTEPVLADYAWVNQDTATAVSTYGGIYMASPAAANIDQHILKIAAPATPYVMTAGFIFNCALVQYPGAGLVFRKSSNGYLHCFNIYYDVHLHIISVKMTDVHGAGEAGYETATDIRESNRYWLRIADDGTNRICSWSLDGISFHTLHTIGRTDFITADEIGIFLCARNASWAAYAHFFHLSIT